MKPQARKEARARAEARDKARKDLRNGVISKTQFKNKTKKR